MLEIIPNWHPIFVHFTVALLSLAVGLFVVTPFVNPPLQEQWRIVARWALWFGTGFAIFTGITGLYAYNTVAHDTPSHEAMTEHRNLALVTITLFLSLTVWSIIRVRKQQSLSMVFVVMTLVSGGVLASTAWHGGELVYRFGLGVMSLPKSGGKGHTHSHGNGDEHGHKLSNESATDMHNDAHEHPVHEDDHDAPHAHEGTAMHSNDNAATDDQHGDGHAHSHPQ